MLLTFSIQFSLESLIEYENIQKIENLIILQASKTIHLYMYILKFNKLKLYGTPVYINVDKSKNDQIKTSLKELIAVKNIYC